ncbi:MAG: nucleotidyltransferase family protein [Deltaproteobacteria bacterium]|nr:nucleotidyltransferase family protein [Deltaproteobacteria bacterium]
MLCRKPTAGIVLAAGLSSRFGRPKQLLELGGKPLLQWTLDACLESKIDCIYLVLGYKSQEIMETLSKKIKHPHLKVIVNRNYRKGQSTSLQAGVAVVSGAFPSAMFILGDQPLIDVASINLLLERYWASEKNICVPLFHKKRGNPTIFSRKFYDEIISIKGDIGARRIIEENPDQVLGIEVKRSSFFHDINTQKDLEKAQSLIKSLS